MTKLRGLDKNAFTAVQYGALSSDPSRFPLLAVVSNQWDDARKTILVTGGVHGYETSGVQGTILFLQTRAAEYVNTFNVVVIPCVSPWGYERIEVRRAGWSEATAVLFLCFSSRIYPSARRFASQYFVCLSSGKYPSAHRFAPQYFVCLSSRKYPLARRSAPRTYHSPL